VSFEPFSLDSRAASWSYILARVVGAVLVVPVMEELFWRGFLLRWLINPDFRSVPMGAFTPFSFWATVVLFGVEHEQWLAGMICGALLNGLLYRTKSLFACVIAHATANALLASWVLARADWKFW
jgi:CAAX prenyl protease-like protein